MLRRLSLGLVGLSLAAVAVACNSNDGTPGDGSGLGPSFGTNSVYAADSTRNAIGIWQPGAATGSAPAYQIGGTSTTLDGPQYIALDPTGNIFLTNYDAGTHATQIVEFKALATGNVIPLSQFTYTNLGQPRGIALDSINGIAVATTDNTAVSPALPGQIQVFSEGLVGSTTPTLVVTGNLTGLNVPSGVAFDSTHAIYVTNLQGASIEKFVIPTPTPTPVATATPVPTATPTATPTPTASPTPTAAPPGPTPTPTASPAPAYFDNLAPAVTISGALTGLINPTGIALDSSGNMWVSDATAKAVYEFAAAANGNVAPLVTISGALTGFVSPSDVKIDSNGKIYVADSGAGKIFIFAATATGNVAPTTTLLATGSLVGIGIAP